MRRAASVLLGLSAAGCSTYVEDVGGRTFFSGLEGARVPTHASGRPAGWADPRVIPEIQVREELADGSVVLRSRSARHLMRHIYETVRDGEAELFADQVLSSATRTEFAENGATAEEGFDFLVEHFSDIEALFARMPMGEYTPNAVLEPIGPGMNRVRLVGGVGRDLRWQGFDMIQEGGNQRLLWFFDAGR